MRECVRVLERVYVFCFKAVSFHCPDWPQIHVYLFSFNPPEFWDKHMLPHLLNVSRENEAIILIFSIFYFNF